MIIVLIDHEIQTLEVLHLTDEEEQILNNFDYLDDDEQERVETVLRRRGIEISDFNPTWMVCEHELPVFDEVNSEEPLYVIR